MYSSEVFGQTHREVGMSLAVAINLFLAGVLAMSAPFYVTRLENKYMTLMGTFTGLTFVAFVLVWLFMRDSTETASLEEMNVRVPFCFSPGSCPMIDH
jgi:zinc transporter ZupT